MHIIRRNNPYSGIIVLYGTTEGCIITAQQLPTEKEVKESQDFIESQCLFQVFIGKFPKKNLHSNACIIFMLTTCTPRFGTEKDTF
jgi:hypothetical protein